MKKISCLLVLVVLVLGVSSIALANAVESGGEQVTIELGHIPEDYRKPLKEVGQIGRLVQVYYDVYNYINEDRQLVSNQNISPEEAGREVVTGDPIEKRFQIYLPPGYRDEDKETKYDVLYLLHGVGGTSYEWPNGATYLGTYVICNLLDHLILNGEIEPVIVVFPEGRSSHDWKDTSFSADKTNILGFYYLDYELRYDLIPYVEANFNTKADISDRSPEGIAKNRKHRAIGGLSMGGMQTLNLIIGGYRSDFGSFAGAPGNPGNGLAGTVKAPGMLDLFAHVASFSPAPTSSDGRTLGESIAASPYKIDLLYLTCGDADGTSLHAYNSAIDGLRETAGDKIGAFYQVTMERRGHDFSVWNNGAYNFLRLSFGRTLVDPADIAITLEYSR